MKKKERVLTEKQQAFLDNLMACDGDFRAAMSAAGYSDNIPVRQVVDSLRDEIIEVSKSYLAMNAPKAAAKMTSILDNPNVSGASNLLKAANSVLDKLKVGGNDEGVLKVPSGGLFVLPAKVYRTEADAFVIDPDNEDYET